MKTYLQKVTDGGNLTQAEMAAAFDQIMNGEATPAQIGALITALRMKGETVDEIAGGAESMRRHAVFIDCAGLSVVDTCGTGGDGQDTFNISTTAALVVAGAGVPVAKHGNRAITSACGSADVLMALGVNLDATPETVEDCVREAGIGFMFAPALTEPFAQVLLRLGTRRAFIVHGQDGMDEITVTTTTRISELNKGTVKTYEFDPLPLIEDFAAAAALKGGDPETNAGILKAVLSGEKGPARDIVCLNAGAAIAAGGKADSIGTGWEVAQASINSGRAMQALENLVACSNLE